MSVRHTYEARTRAEGGIRIVDTRNDAEIKFGAQEGEAVWVASADWLSCEIRIIGEGIIGGWQSPESATRFPLSKDRAIQRLILSINRRVTYTDTAELPVYPRLSK